MSELNLDSAFSKKDFQMALVFSTCFMAPLHIPAPHTLIYTYRNMHTLHSDALDMLVCGLNTDSE